MKNRMGEVKVKVKIINATDEGLFRRGKLPKDQIRFEEIEAVVDTGATTSVLPSAVAKQLGLEILRQERASYANGYGEKVDVAETVVFEILGRRCPEEPFIIGDEVLIGQIPLERMDLVVDCKNQLVMPNPEHPDMPTFRV
jgi:clan AA aspartic protease